MKTIKIPFSLKDLKLVLGISCLLLFVPGFNLSKAYADERKESCFGFVWCHVEEGDRISTDALFYLYSKEERRGYSRFAVRPFYSEELDSEKHHIRKSILWPLGNSEMENNDLYFWVIPFYYQHDNEKTGYSFRFAPLVYGYYSDPEILLKRLSLIGLPPFPQLRSIPTLSLYEHVIEKKGSTDRFFPIYRYKSSYDGTNSDLNILLLFNRMKTPEKESEFLFPVFSYDTDKVGKTDNLSILGYKNAALLRHFKSPSFIESHFVPLYGYRHSEELSEITALGLPPMGGSWALSLFDYRATPERISSRFFPVYGYGHDLKTDDYDLNAMLLYRHEEREGKVKDAFLPVYSYERNVKLNQGELGALGVGSASLFLHKWDDKETSDWMIPVYGYRHDENGIEITLLGLPPMGGSLALSLFDYRATPERISSRFFPIYGFDHDLKTDHYDLNAMLLYRHKEEEGEVTDAFLPLYSYEQNKKLNEGRFGALGIGPVSLYQHRWDKKETSDWLVPVYGYQHKGDMTEITALGLPPMEGSLALSLFDYRATPERVTSRFFPMYDYDHDFKTGHYDLNALLLYRHQAGADGEVKDALLPLYSYEQNNRLHQGEFGVLGISSVSLYRHEWDNNKTTDWLVPLYGYRHEGETSELTALGLPPTGGSLTLSLFDYKLTPERVTSRFFPVYGYDHDLKADHYDLNALLLYHHEKGAEEVKDSFFPIYTYERSRILNQGRFGAVGVGSVSLYRHRWGMNGTADWLVPVYGYQHEGNLTEVTALGLPPVEGSMALSLFDYRATPERISSRFFPVYGYGHDLKSDDYDLNVLLLYRHEEGEGKVKDALLPVYSYERNLKLNQGQFGALGVGSASLFQHKWDDKETSDWLIPVYGYRYEEDLTEITALGLPPMGGSLPLSLFDYRKGPERVTSRFFPVYGYDHDLKADHYDLNALLLYHHEKGAEEVKDAFLPVYTYERNRNLNQGRFGAVGVGSVSLYQHRWDGEKTTDWLFPVYGYYHKGESYELAALGLPPMEGSLTLSLFDYRATPEKITSRFFPVYGYGHDLKTNHYDLNALLLYYHEADDDKVKDTFIPIYSYERNKEKNETGFGLIGISEYSLYYHMSSVQMTKDRFFPIYRYKSNYSKNEKELAILWPLADYKKTGEENSEFNMLWWLVNYQKTNTNNSFRFLGGEAVAFLVYEKSGNHFRFELNPVLPLYSLEEKSRESSEWNILGGLIGYKKDPSGKGRMRFLWII